MCGKINTVKPLQLLHSPASMGKDYKLFQVNMEGPLSVKETLDGIVKVFEKEHGKGCPSTLLTSLKQNVEKADLSEDVIMT